MIRRLAVTIPFFSSIASIDAFLPPCHLSKASLTSASSSAPQTILRNPFEQRQVERRLPRLYIESSDDDAAEKLPIEEEKTVQVPEAELPSEDDSDILNSPAFLRRKVDVLESDLAALEKEIEEANAVYKAGKEEWGSKFDDLNRESQLIQERMSRQGQLGTEQATMDVARKMLEVIDNYERAFNSMDATTDEENEITDAYKKSYDMILDAFAELNVTKVETVGSEFDYELHQAVMQLPNDEYDEGIVCSELAPGWICGDKLIRPAMVCVSAG